MVNGKPTRHNPRWLEIGRPVRLPGQGFASACYRELIARLRHEVIAFVTAPELLDAHRWNWPTSSDNNTSTAISSPRKHTVFLIP